MRMFVCLFVCPLAFSQSTNSTMTISHRVITYVTSWKPTEFGANYSRPISKLA